VRAVKSDLSHHVNRSELDTLLDTDVPECTALVWLQGEVKDALFKQMLKAHSLLHKPYRLTGGGILLEFSSSNRWLNELANLHFSHV